MQSSSSMIWILRAATLDTETPSVRSRGAEGRYVKWTLELVKVDDDSVWVYLVLVFHYGTFRL